MVKCGYCEGELKSKIIAGSDFKVCAGCKAIFEPGKYNTKYYEVED